jgi:hypothetical protein
VLQIFTHPATTYPSPLEGEGWGEGLQTISLRDKCEAHNQPPLPNPLPQGERGLVGLYYTEASSPLKGEGIFLGLAFIYLAAVSLNLP